MFPSCRIWFSLLYPTNTLSLKFLPVEKGCGTWALTQFYVTKFYLCRKHGETALYPTFTDPVAEYTSLLSAHRLTRIDFELLFLNLSTGLDNCFKQLMILHTVTPYDTTYNHTLWYYIQSHLMILHTVTPYDTTHSHTLWYYTQSHLYRVHCLYTAICSGKSE
jgi:hypothetical protein